MKYIKKLIDFQFHKEDLFAVIALLVSCIVIYFFKISEIYENGFFENIQLVALIAGFILCFKTKKYKVFFNFVAIVLFLVIAREISYGRAIFARVPNSLTNELYPWTHYKYGWLAHVAVGIYIVWGILYALINKVWLDIINIVKTVRFPFWTFLSAFCCIGIQIFSENVLHDSCIEETSELVLYCLVLSVILIYLKKINK